MQHRFSRIFTFTLSLVLAISLAACGQTAGNSGQSRQAGQGSSPSAAPAEGKITVEDAQGTVTLPKKPERIVTMDFSFTDMLVTLSVQPVGIADDSNKDLFMDVVKNQLKSYTSVGSRYEPNIELISSLKPDLIIVDINKHKNALPQLKAIAPILVLNDFQADYEQMLKNYIITSKAVGKEAEGKKRLEEHQAKMEAAKKKIKDANLAVLPAVVNPTGFFGHSDHSYSGSMLKMLGFTDPLKSDTAYPQLTLEQLVETNPQALFLMPTDKVTIVNQWETNPLWKKIDAVAKNKVYTVERRDWSLSRGMLGSEKIAEDILKQLGE
ncbi:ABC transporter substrate-binding protein [Paenibacillus sp. OAS669]|uniref:ABC transporter substrate-binding protein n=1 Tax=Paenibacillus sp. OAS669 TaxID=2663821 RepID=UPI00178B35B3|nr:Fe(3+) dicitrate ABC transporter substrate-binding protein [Paenibacillus sp. OAS669]MBE1443757.1 iron complex transport system substrate-binding protein [Paenibacillus sp. OAS669]